MSARSACILSAYTGFVVGVFSAAAVLLKAANLWLLGGLLGVILLLACYQLAEAVK